MSANPRVSVITIFLNAEKFIDEAIESVFSQTYEDWELLLVDDGSTDRSTDIALRYVDQFPNKVRYLEHEGHLNKGMSASRNAGILKAQGEFIALLDADDVWLPGKIERQVSIIEQHPDIGLVFNPLIHLYEDGPRDPQPATLSPGKNEKGAWTLKMLESDDNGACPSSVMIRTDVARAVGGFEESFRGMFQLFEDQVMWNKIGLNAQIYYDPEPMTLYRMHGTSCWGKSSKNEQLFARVHLYAWLIRYLKQYTTGQFHAELHCAIGRYHSVWLRYLVDMEQFEVAAAFVESLEQQLPAFPDDADLNYLAAFSLHHSHARLNDAVYRYDQTLKNGYDEFWVCYNRGALHMEMGNLEQARTDLLRAVELKPDHEELQHIMELFHTVWLRHLVDMEQFEAAAAFVGSLEQQLPAFPDNADLNYLAAFSLHHSHTRLNDAVDRYDQALKNGYDEFWVCYNRGALHMEMGNLEQARTDLLRAVELKPDHEELQHIMELFHTVWLRHLVDMEQFEAAAAFVGSLEQQLPAFPDDADLNYLAAFSLHHSHTRLNDAVYRYDQALKNGYDEFWVCYNRGALYMEMGNLEQARTDLLRAVELKPGDEGASEILYQIFIQEKK